MGEQFRHRLPNQNIMKIVVSILFLAALAFAEPELTSELKSGPNPDPAADAWYGYYGYPGYYGHRYYGYGGYYGHRYGYGYWGRKKREANPQVLLAHPYAYAHYVPTTYVAPTVFNHENHPSTVITATGHHVYAAPWVVPAKPAVEAERKKREAAEPGYEGPNPEELAGPNAEADPAADAWYAYYGHPYAYGYGYGLGGYYGHRYYGGYYGYPGYGYYYGK